MTETASPAPVRNVLPLRLVWQVPVTLVLVALVVATTGVTMAAVPAIALAAVAAELARTDATVHRLPNRLTVPVIAIGLVVTGVRLLLGELWAPGLLPVAAVSGTVLALGLVGAFGMGDAKLGIAMALAGPTPLVIVAAPILGTLFAGVAAVVVLARGGRGRRLPLGPFLLAGWAVALALQFALAVTSPA
ncbi:prepilin peptidase [Schumannella sp. 10F1B-5-1]|uniref:prepilin peptidase n=1 Tax=Schumannella sp. 10F1B-5-1 TaxID=2590780 RepID=UPI0011328D76